MLKLPSIIELQEFRKKVTDLHNTIFRLTGLPATWEESGSVPSEPGVIVEFYKIPILIKETTGLDRINEPIEVNITFDEDCINKTWNNTIRIYDRDLKETIFRLSNENFCSDQYIKNATVTFIVNLSSNQNKVYEIFYYRDRNISEPNNTLTFNTNSWIPNDGDTWTEDLTDWSRYGGGSGVPTLDSTNKKTGTSSVSITGTFSSNTLGLEYNPPSNITGAENWYLRAWLFVDDITGLTSLNISISDNQEIITRNVLNEMNSGQWYLFEKELSPSVWSNWNDFNASRGIDFIRFFAVNNSESTRTIKIDGLRFEKNPLNIIVFPEERIDLISSTKLKLLKNLSIDEISNIIGKGYKFRIEIEESK
ncbi:MAG: hypothetical protein QXO27_04015 [Candidatus Aenigmatarchaeota archaeon]